MLEMEMATPPSSCLGNAGKRSLATYSLEVTKGVRHSLVTKQQQHTRTERKCGWTISNC